MLCVDGEGYKGCKWGYHLAAHVTIFFETMLRICDVIWKASPQLVISRKWKATGCQCLWSGFIYGPAGGKDAGLVVKRRRTTHLDPPHPRDRDRKNLTLGPGNLPNAVVFLLIVCVDCAKAWDSGHDHGKPWRLAHVFESLELSDGALENPAAKCR